MESSGAIMANNFHIFITYYIYIFFFLLIKYNILIKTNFALSFAFVVAKHLKPNSNEISNLTRFIQSFNTRYYAPAQHARYA